MGQQLKASGYWEHLMHGRPQCAEELRDGRCVMDAGHRGRHTTVGFYCDACGNVRRGHPVAFAYNQFDGGIEAEFCFMCERGLTPHPKHDEPEPVKFVIGESPGFVARYTKAHIVPVYDARGENMPDKAKALCGRMVLVTLDWWDYEPGTCEHCKARYISRFDSETETC